MQPDVRSRVPRQVSACVFFLAVVTGALAGGASASVGLDTGATHPTLLVDAKGDAQVTWVARGGKESVVIPPTGQLYHGALADTDVSKPTTIPGVPFAVTLRSSPGGVLWALQLIQIGVGKPTTLDFSRWKGAPTDLTLTTDGTHVRGTVSFQGKPITGHSFTLAGLRPRIYVYIDCFACGGQAGWSPMLGVAPRADGSFSVLIRSTWRGSRYRATVAGDNVGSTYEPDAQTVIAAPLRPLLLSAGPAWRRRCCCRER